MEDRGLWGRELHRISDQVRAWPAPEQRSAAIRGWSPLRHSNLSEGSPSSPNPNQPRSGEVRQENDDSDA